jgi:hypothetical protein
MVDEGRITFKMNLGLKEEFQNLYKGRIMIKITRYDTAEYIEP